MKKIIIFAALAFSLALFASFASAQTGFSSVTYQQPSVSYSSSDYNTYWPALTQQQCQGRQDLLLQVAPGGCQPVVVRSDLLAQQVVPVFCQVSALQINPLIDINSIDSMSFSGSKYPPEVSGTGFHPAQIALSSSYGKLTGNSVLNNIGYVVVLLKMQPNESALPDSVNLNLTARITYNANNALGIGQASFTIPQMSDAEWNSNATAHSLQSFWQGRYFARVESASDADAVISIYYGNQKISTVDVKKGQTSSDIFIPGFSSCQATLQVAYDGFQSDSDHARLEITDNRGTDSIDAYSSGTGIFGGSNTKFYDNNCYVQRVDVSDSIGTGHGSVDIICGSQRASLSLNKIYSGQSANAAFSGGMISLDTKSLQYYQNALGSYTDVAVKYPSAAQTNGQQTYGQQALAQAIELAKSANDVKSETTLVNLMLNTYPDYNPDYYSNILSSAQSTDFGSASATLSINNRIVTIKLTNLIKGSSDASVNLRIGGANVNAVQHKLNDKFDLGNANGAITISAISPSNVQITSSCSSKSATSTTVTLQQGGSANLCGTQVIVDKINVATLASIRILPNVHNTETDTNLSLSIGIEKRAIQLSPAKTTEMIKNINASIQKWESISNTLGKTVTGLKTACFATAAVLTAENFLNGIDGTSIARQKVMQGDNGWTAKCQAAFRSGKPVSGLSGTQPYASVDDCLQQNSDSINNDVTLATNALSKVNQQISQNDASNKQSSSLFGDTINTEKSAEATISNIKSSFSADTNQITVNGQPESLGSFVGKLQTTAFQNNIVSYSDLRDFDYYATVLETQGISQVQKDAATQQLSSIMARVENAQQQYDTRVAAQKSAGSSYLSPIDTYGQKNSVQGNYYGNKYDGSISGISSSLNGQPYTRIIYGPNQYAIFLKDQGQNKFTPDTSNIYLISGSAGTVSASPVTDNALITQITSTVSVFQKVDASTYTNKYNNPQVQYWETDPYKGMPSIVPVDTINGWYAATEQTLPIFGQQTAFESSGKVSSFWLCNVGQNGKEEFDKSSKGDDICQQFNLNTGQATTFFPGLTQAQTNTLVQKAITELNNVARQHLDGIKSVKLTNGQSVSVGSPSVNVPTAQCQDYMSPKECQLLFNVCDPVICPSSRCNLGGQYPVANVPQTGIIGSTLLCLPNAREGIAIPFCLTGIQSGIDGFVSLLKNHRDCLQEQLDTGQTVGICDQIYSVYSCEFFWNQVAPVAKLLLPKLVETAYGQGTKGGGEYLTVAAAWQNTQQAINYFTQQYAVNSLQAFQVRSVDQFGDQFCKAFGSMTAPKTFQTLVQPDSPPQFNAWFSSTPYSDVTVPATAEYKAFYHIFAGKDRGVYYEVYLKNPPQTSYFSTAQTVLVASGFVTTGQYASETKDFTAPAGYKELCVRINNQEQCGFNQVSTSFAANYVADSITSSTLTTQGISTESGCVSGDPNTGAVIGQLAQGSIQGAAQASITSQVYNQGIIRICSTNDPGSASAPGRFIDVGYCGDQNIRCWLDTQSVNQAISNMSVGINNATVTQLQQQAASALNSQQFITDTATANANLAGIQTEIDNLQQSSAGALSTTASDSDLIITEIQALQPKLLLDQSKAYALFLLGEVNDVVASRAIDGARAQQQQLSSTAQVQTTSTAATITNTSWTKASAPAGFVHPLPSGGVYVLSINGNQSILFIGSSLSTSSSNNNFSLYQQRSSGITVSYIEVGKVNFNGTNYIIVMNDPSTTQSIVDSVQQGLYSALNNQKLVISS